MDNIYLPHIARIVSVRDETADTKTFSLKFRESQQQSSWTHKPGQFLELSVFGRGEAPFCLASSPTRSESLQVTARRTGVVTDALHSLGEGGEVGIRGPYGNGFSVEGAYGKNVLFVGGGIGLPPLRSLIWNMLDQRDKFRNITILYGARTPTDLVYKDELKEWEQRDDVNILVTVDRAEPGWEGNVGMVPTLFEKVPAVFERLKQGSNGTLAYVCGPPIMIRFVIQDLLARGFTEESIISTLERMMQCGVGKCNHCAIGHKYVCRDGPVFTYSEIKGLVE